MHYAVLREIVIITIFGPDEKIGLSGFLYRETVPPLLGLRRRKHAGVASAVKTDVFECVSRFVPLCPTLSQLSHAQFRTPFKRISFAGSRNLI
jgi:hypothetical protein